jgi:hypothetical protein
MSEEMKFEVPTVSEIYDYIADIAMKIKDSNLKIDTIVGIARGGMVPARFISDFLLIPDIKIVYAGFYIGPKKHMEKPIIYTPIEESLEDKNVLIVDDVADTGETIIAVIDHLKEKGARNVYVAVIYVKPWNKAPVDFYARETDAWIVFPWEFTETAYQLLKMESWEKFRSIIINDEKFRRIIEKFLGRKL